VSNIEYRAFDDCQSLSTAIIGNGVTSIGEYAFQNCPLDDLTVLASNAPTISENTFNNYNTLHVKPGAKANYSTKDYWNKFKIVEDATSIIDELTITQKDINLYIGDTVTIGIRYSPEDAINLALNWTSSDPAVASVDQNGLVTAFSSGSTTITVMTTDGSDIQSSCQVNVEKRPLPNYSNIEMNGIYYHLDNKYSNASVIVRENYDGVDENYAGAIIVPDSCTNFR